MKHVIEATYRTAAGEVGTLRIEAGHEFSSSSVFSIGQVMGWLMTGARPDHVRTFTVSDAVPVASPDDNDEVL